MLKDKENVSRVFSFHKEAEVRVGAFQCHTP